MKWRSIIISYINKFHPAYFAMVMATGIMSIAFEAMAYPGIARALFALNLVFYPVLCLPLFIRIMFFLPDLIADLKNFRHAQLFLTFVVGTNTIGIQIVLFHQAVSWAIFLWFAALTGWLTCMYFILSGFISMREKPLCEIISGSTLLITVSTVSISLLGSNLLNSLNIVHGSAYLAVAGFLILGFVSYLIIITLLAYRLFFTQFEPVDWDAPYWICMGAAAIITLGACEFISRMHLLPVEEGLRETVLWLTVFVWMIGTLWLPYLLFMDIQKYTRVDVSAPAPLWIKTFPWLRLAFGKAYYAYVPSSWSRVFPMGMYTAGLLSLKNTTELGFLAIISQYWGWFALLIWFLTLIGMLRALISFIVKVWIQSDISKNKIE